MSWNGTAFRDLSDELCADFLFSYLQNKPKNSELKDAYYKILHYIVGSIQLKAEFRIVSKKAKILAEEYKIKKITTSKSYSKQGMRVEHTIPINVIVDYLKKIPESKITIENICKLIKTVRGVSLITIEEDNQLKSNKLNSCLPPDCTIDNLIDDPDNYHFGIRYEKANIEY